MKRIPILASLVVIAAVAVMIALGLWQLRRAEWKEALLARYAANADLAPVTMSVGADPDSYVYRRATGICATPIKWTSRSGQNRAGEGGWRHIAACRDGLTFDMGWSRRITPPPGYQGGTVSGILDADRDHGLILVAREPVPGLEPSRPPSPTEIPNNHRGYAGQWFLFAGVAGLIYLIALRRRWRQTLAADGAHG